MSRPLKHILCVDDEADILAIMQMCLENVGGFQVTTLNSGTDAIKKAADINPDLIMLDVMMPEIDGPTTLKALRQIPALQHTPIIFSTARVQPAEVAEYLQIGAAGVVAKPFDPMEISEQVKEIWNMFYISKD